MLTPNITTERVRTVGKKRPDQPPALHLNAYSDTNVLGTTGATYSKGRKMGSQQDWIDRAHKVLPAGTFGNFDAGIVIARAEGARVWDEDGREYVDFLISSGPMLLGHGHPEVLEVAHAQIDRGMTYFANNADGIALAEDICAAVPCAQRVRFLTSGGEADMYAIRAARAFTGRSKVMKFEGGYHGMSAEAQMSLAPVELRNFPSATPDSAGIPDAVREEMLIAPFNDPAFAKSLIAEHGHEIACIIVEPLQRLIPPEAGFLQTLRDLATAHGIVLIFDEIVTGFRLAYGGAQEAYGVEPDLCTLGKIIGGGFPLAALAGRKDIMDHFDVSVVGRDRFLMQLGTLAGNPVAAAAGRKSMEILARDGAYARLKANGQVVWDATHDALNEHGIAHQMVGDPTLFDVIFTKQPVRNYRDSITGDPQKLAAYNAILRRHGVFKAPGKTYPCLALTDRDLDQTISAIRIAARQMMDDLDT